MYYSEVETYIALKMVSNLVMEGLYIMKLDNLLKGKVAIVTGGAMGMGNGTARTLAENGAKVYLIDMSDTVESAAEKLRVEGLDVGSYQVDITDSKKLTTFYDEIAKENGRIDILCNVAGIGSARDFLEVDDENYEKTMSVNVRGTWYSCKAAVPHMIKNGYGKIVNFGSITGVSVADPGWTVYGTSKGAISGFTKSLASELAPKNITVNAILPGQMDTPLMRNAILKEAPPESLNSILEEISSTIPMNRLGTIEDAGNVALFLASDLSSYVTGQNIKMDGALTLSETPLGSNMYS